MNKETRQIVADTKNVAHQWQEGYYDGYDGFDEAYPATAAYLEGYDKGVDDKEADTQ